MENIIIKLSQNIFYQTTMISIFLGTAIYIIYGISTIDKRSQKRMQEKELGLTENT
jgi:hypothetical protein